MAKSEFTNARDEVDVLIERAANRVWRFVRDNCMSLDSGRCTDLIRTVIAECCAKSTDVVEPSLESLKSEKRTTAKLRRHVAALRRQLKELNVVPVTVE